jgi:aspartyl protease family protein
MSDLVFNEPVLVLAIVGLLAAAAGWMTEHDRPAFARGLRGSGYLAMLAAGLFAVGQAASNAKRSDANLALHSRPTLSVSAGETVIPLAADGHFWVEASVNGEPVEFLVDTGATFTGLSRPTARRAGVMPTPGELPQEMITANGPIQVTMGVANEISFGSITARSLPVAVPKDFDDDTNLLGMNFLSQLKTWRVEGDKLILVP